MAHFLAVFDLDLGSGVRGISNVDFTTPTEHPTLKDVRALEAHAAQAARARGVVLVNIIRLGD